MATRKHPGTPNYHIASARKGQPAMASIPRVLRTPADLARENQESAFKWGIMVGFAVAALIFARIMEAEHPRLKGAFRMHASQSDGFAS